jgi:hypothetical protein
MKMATVSGHFFCPLVNDVTGYRFQVTGCEPET